MTTAEPEDEKPDDREECDACDGNGWVYDPAGGTMNCEECDGEGKI